MDGLEGSLIIRVPKSQDGNSAQYDFDLPSHVIILSDWMHSMTDSKFPGNTHNDTRIKADALLINGQNQIVSEPYPKILQFIFTNFEEDIFHIITSSFKKKNQVIKEKKKIFFITNYLCRE